MGIDHQGRAVDFESSKILFKTPRKYSFVVLQKAGNSINAFSLCKKVYQRAEIYLKCSSKMCPDDTLSTVFIWIYNANWKSFDVALFKDQERQYPCEWSSIVNTDIA